MIKIKIYYNLKSYDGRKFYLTHLPLTMKKRRLEDFIQSDHELSVLDVAKKNIFSFETIGNDSIPTETNPAIANIKDDDKKKRLTNLYKAYRYILENHPITPETLKELYDIISKDDLDDFSKSHMGEFYRQEKVFMMSNDGFRIKFGERTPVNRIQEFMDTFFAFLNNTSHKSQIEEYIKSQILHAYLVYIHPYFDANRRTSRTLAMWYLINKNAYPYTIFNRGIAFNRSEYNKALFQTIQTYDLTHFIGFMLDTVQTEFEKEYVIKRIEQELNEPLDSLNYRTLLYLLTMKNPRTIRNFTYTYNTLTERDRKNPQEIYRDMLIPLLDRGILDIKNNSQKTADDLQNRTLVLRPIDLNKKKIHKLII